MEPRNEQEHIFTFYVKDDESLGFQKEMTGYMCIYKFLLF